ncbi:hypothetical protein J4771_06035 [Candidatus Kaistella beijingensis]|uniref:hypothetical protein n=1 Tax=Candidatus Kaistella beijingensis TaxID=2820270 RepID=UPI001CC7C474|nr:hypothetical protein [Candidatus Kaistella beijingensis]UBB90898.1 hypothetical protein J4771_06035 [Candidatus Kaistella beijingensis]
MKKEIIYFIAALLLFCVGFLLGKTQNDNGRYFLKSESNGVVIFDTSTGVIYFGELNTKKYLEVDIKNATSKKYKPKK